jgi:hypothetical protein
MDNITRAEATYAQTRFDIAQQRIRLAKRHRRQALLEYVAVAAGLVLVIFITFWVYGISIYNLMPDPLQ